MWPFKLSPSKKRYVIACWNCMFCTYGFALFYFMNRVVGGRSSQFMDACGRRQDSCSPFCMHSVHMYWHLWPLDGFMYMYFVDFVSLYSPFNYVDYRLHSRIILFFEAIQWTFVIRHFLETYAPPFNAEEQIFLLPELTADTHWPSSTHEREPLKYPDSHTHRHSPIAFLLSHHYPLFSSQCYCFFGKSRNWHCVF